MCHTRICRTRDAGRGTRDPRPATHDPRPGREAGFTLAGVLVILTVIMVFVAYTVPRQWSEVMGRERDQEAIFAMKQYARAILIWQQHHGGLPTSLDQLKQARTPRVVRGFTGEIPDPITGKMDWQLIPPAAAGQPVTPTNPNNAPYQGQRIGGNMGPPPDAGTSTAPGTGTATPSAPKDYVGPFVGVRPAKTGKAYVVLNGAENYEQWTYTINDLTAEINARQAAIVTSK